MGQEELLSKIAGELGLDFNEESINLMLIMLENGVSPDNLVGMLEDVKAEIILKKEREESIHNNPQTTY